MTVDRSFALLTLLAAPLLLAQELSQPVYALRSLVTQEGNGYKSPPLEIPKGKMAVILSEFGVGAFDKPMPYGDQFCSYAFLTSEDSTFRLPAPLGKEFAGPVTIRLVSAYDDGRGKGFAQITVRTFNINQRTDDLPPLSLILQSTTNAVDWQSIATNSVAAAATNTLFRLQIQPIAK